MPPRRRLLLVLAAAIAVLTAACSAQDGRTLPPPDPDDTTTTTAVADDPVIQAPEAAAFLLTSPSFVDGGPLPEDLSCAGAGTSPDLSWSGTPTDAVELALVVRDRSAGGFLHWVVTGIDPLVTGFGRGGLPEGTVQATNGTGETGWAAPCPPAGTGPHSYEITLHALAGSLAVEDGTPGDAAAALIEQASTARTSLTVTFEARPA